MIVENYVRPAIPRLLGEKGFIYIAKARELAAKGIRVVNFGVGQPDFKPPRHVIEEAKRALDEGFTGYTESQGIRELREAIADYLNERYGAGVSPDEILVTTGAKTAIFMSVFALLEPGDEILVLEPSYYAYSEAARAAGARPVFVPLEWRGPSEGFRISVEAVEEAITPRTKLMVLNNPHNPTGTVFSPEEVDALYDIARRKKIVILADEIYDNFVYEGRFKSLLEHSEWKDYVIYVNGHSKTFAMTGFRLGYLAAKKEVVAALRRLAVNIYSCAPSISQRAGVAALRGPWEPVKEMIEEYRARRNLVYEELSRIPGFEVAKPHGAFYIFPRIAKILEEAGLSTDEFSEKLAAEKAVVALPGTNFPDKAGEGFLRISFAVSRDDIREGAKRIRGFVEELLAGSKK
ncbi:pyridoxal phosphate-dependent aminotransferase [Pyrofollis japonicus]|uniref:pyridoxal phosphate-dependent aminotransferase n=1 Tax=Pyrofollis japonicus TaxID=3060460 RepID=UPI00295A9307|nr:pyridoxal phosphate-dependent aminotransferase [Pyrofollis japonicus]BEP18330.1 pyridoxal phosphate-dependent aminotransferase [Pyrofollis japonicus]